MTKRYKINRKNGRWCVMVYDAANAVWFSVGGTTELRVAFDVWLGLIGKGGKK